MKRIIGTLVSPIKKVTGGLLTFLFLALLPWLTPTLFPPMFPVGQFIWWEVVKSGFYLALILILISEQTRFKTKDIRVLILGVFVHAAAYFYGAHVLLVAGLAILQLGLYIITPLPETLREDFPKLANLVLILTGVMYVVLG